MLPDDHIPLICFFKQYQNADHTSDILDQPQKEKKEKKEKASKKSNKDGRSVVLPKYRNPASGQTWTGRGKKPKWLEAALANGKKISDFKI
jgi:DNA-binding protein H-NS